MSKKFQITLPDDVVQEWRSAAARRGIPLAELIRETMQDYLRDSRPVSSDPLKSVTGLLEAEDPDLSQRVDEILYR